MHWQLIVEVMQLFSDDEETEQVYSGENVKLKLKNVEEEVRHAYVTRHIFFFLEQNLLYALF